MQTFLIIAPYKDAAESEIETIKNRLKVTNWNTHLITPLPSIGIMEIRKIKQLLSLRPMGETNRLIIITDMDKATVEAQNALLKILEEPPKSTYLVLTARNPNNLLPTVVSRCQVISKGNREKQGENHTRDEEKILIEILAGSPGQRIIYVQEKIKTKEDGMQFLDKILGVLKQFLISQTQRINLSKGEIALLISKVIAAKKYISGNINFKATLDVLLLGFPTQKS